MLFSPKTPTNANLNKKLLGYRVQSSVFGAPIPIPYGKVRLTGNVLWTGDWQAHPVSGGKGKTGGKGQQQQFTYTSALLIGLCQGPIKSITGVWSDRDQYRLAVGVEKYVVPPGGGTHNSGVPASQWFLNVGVTRTDFYNVTANDYGSPASANLSGTMETPMALVPSSPGAGQYTLAVGLDNAHYTFSAADAGKTVTVTYLYQFINTSTTGDPLTHLNLVLFDGSQGQAPWNWMISRFPNQALGYSELAYIGSASMDLGSSGVIPNLSFETWGRCSFGGGIVDCVPADIINDLLLDPLCGAATGPTGWSSDDLPAPGDPFGLDSSGEVYQYCAANGLFTSLSVDNQQSAATWIRDLLTIANANTVYSEGVLKFRSYGDTTAVGNGFTYTPQTQPEYDLDDDDFICAPGQPPITVSRGSVRDAWNRIGVEWTNRENGYNQETLYEQDDWAADTFGVRTDSPKSLHGIHLQTAAQLVASTLVKRSVYIRNQYHFTLPIYYARLDPMDLVTLTDPYLGFVKLPVRIVSIEEDGEGRLAVVAEDFPWSCSGPTIHGKQVTGSFGPGYFAAPGSVNPPAFVALPPEVTQGSEYSAGIGLSGGPDWGGCDVYVSTDGGNSYSRIGLQTGPATMGTLTSPLASAADPDTGDTLSVDLTESFGELFSPYTQAQADAKVSLIAVEDELLAYKTATLTALYHYDLSYLRRGCYDSIINAHAAGAPFAVVNGQLYRWDYDASVVGTTVYFKFCSFNRFGAQIEDISQVTAYPYFVSGPRACYPWSPGYVSPQSGDALAGEVPGNFGVQPTFGLDANGSPIQFLSIKGFPPVAGVSKTLGPAAITATVGTSGSIPPGVYVIGVAAADGAAALTPLSNLATVTVPAGNNGSITVNVTWKTGSNGGNVYVATGHESHGFHRAGHLTAGAGSIVLTSIPTDTEGAPDPNYDHTMVRYKRVRHGGVWAQQVQSVTSNSLIFSAGDYTPNYGVNRYAGCTVSLLAKVDPTVEVPFLNLKVVSNTSDTLVIGAGADGNQPPDLTALIQTGDLILMRHNATFTDDGFSDSNIANEYYPDGMAINAEAGAMAVVLDGPDAGDAQPIASNDGTSVTLAGKWRVTPNSGNLVIIVEAAWSPEYRTPPYLVPNNDAGALVVAQPSLLNLAGQTWLVQVHTEDANNVHGPDEFAPVREAYVFGVGAPRTITSSSCTMLPTDRWLLFDTTNGPITLTCLPGAQILGLILIAEKISGDSNSVTIQAADGDLFPGDVTTLVLTDNAANGLTMLKFNG